MKETIAKNEPFDKNSFYQRHKQINTIEKIPYDKTYLLGYYILKKIKGILKENPDNEKAKALLKERDKYISIGKRNQTSYLTSDHLDVYVATSMRNEHDFIFVNQLIDKIFSKEILSELNLRWFDPTQAHCDERIDKGISEALMLKRAKCTLYLAQEIDTLGKDSELASTLAQGKPVIVYIPNGDKSFCDNMIKNLKRINKKSEEEIIIEQLKLIDSSLAWDNEKVKQWINNSEEIDLGELKKFFYQTVKEQYDDRANALQDLHPLAIQVNLESGVANGVLVVRSVSQCIRLIRSIVLNDMNFYLDFGKGSKKNYIFLREKISHSIFRLKTGDFLLTNSFWNLYLDN